MLPNPHIVLAGGGSLGSLLPGIALANALRQRCPQAEISFIGAGGTNERHAVQSVGMKALTVPALPAPSSLLGSVRFLSTNTAGYCAARWMLSELNVTLVIGLGGPVSSVVTYAACSRRTPFMLLEPNAKASTTARRLGAFAEAVCLAFEETQAQLPVRAQVALTGCPVGPGFAQGRRRQFRLAGEPRLLTIMAGTSGDSALQLNQAVQKALTGQQARLENWSIVHQAGEGHLRQVEAWYRSHKIDAVVVSQVDEVASLLRETDLAITRSGGSTVAELACLGVPTVLLPDPGAADNHQQLNAEILEQDGACRLASHRSEQLGSLLAQLLEDDHHRAELSKAMQGWARPSAASAVADICASAIGLQRPAAAA